MVVISCCLNLCCKYYKIKAKKVKEDATHTVSANLMLILSRFIKERYSFTILSENSRVPGGEPWAELKSREHLWADWQQTDVC